MAEKESTKACKSCGESFPQTAEHFYVHSKRAGKERLSTHCKSCHNAIQSERKKMLRKNVPEDKQCGVDGCFALGIRIDSEHGRLCSAHHNRKRRHGDVFGGSVFRTHYEGDCLCSVGGCSTRAAVKGLCKKHYARLRRHGDPTISTKRERVKCSIDDCDRHARLSDHGYCAMHYERWRRNGHPTELSEFERRRLKARNRPILRDGYAAIWMPDHPEASAGRVYEHRVVMEREIGRRLLPGENVHHINGVKDDNRPENLELWVSSQPSGQRPEDLVSWAKEILERYG